MVHVPYWIKSEHSAERVCLNYLMIAEAAASEVRLKDKLTSSGGDFERLDNHNSCRGRHTFDNQTPRAVCMTPATAPCADLFTPGNRSSSGGRPPRAHLSVHEQTEGPGGGDGGLHRFPSADRLDHRDFGQFGGGRDLQAGGRWLCGAALPDGAGAGEERQGERCPAAQAAGHGREDAELREENEETESAGGDARRAF